MAVVDDCEPLGTLGAAADFDAAKIAVIAASLLAAELGVVIL